MKINSILIIILMILVVPIHAGEGSRKESQCFVEPFELVRLINNLNRKAAKGKLNVGNQVGMVIIEAQSKIENWH